MKKRMAFFILFFSAVSVIVPECLSAAEQGPITTLIMVRHAEKSDFPRSDPILTSGGIARADELAYILKYVELDAIYSTPFLRTKQTVQPTAEDKGLNVRLYEPADENFLQNVLRSFPGGTVLIVGHSNTIPRFANELTGKSDFGDLDDTTYDNLFIASVPKAGKAVVLRIRFGAHTPEK